MSLNKGVSMSYALGNCKILAFAGSTREGSWNKKLVKIAARFAEEKKIELTVLDLKDYPLPLYDEDLEKKEGAPAHAHTLRNLFYSHQALLIASPEYNSSVSGVLKNALDWISRSEAGKPDLSPFEGKVAALASASPGALGGMRGLVHLRSILGNMKVLVLPDQVCVPKANEAFDSQGQLKEQKLQEAMEKLVEALHDVAAKINKDVGAEVRLQKTV